MITDEGRAEIGSVLSSLLATHIAVGIGDTPAAAEDSDLQFEVWRGRIEVRAYDPVSKTIHFKTTIPYQLETSVMEIGLLASGINESDSTMIATMSTDTEDWTGAGVGWTTSNVRMGDEALLLKTGLSTMSGVDVNLASYGPKDYIQVAMHVISTTAAPTMRLTSGLGNYFEFPLDTAATGFRVTTMKVEDMAVTGAPDLSNITELSINNTGTANSVAVDAVRAMRIDEGSQLIKRDVVALTKKSQDISMDVEVSLTL